jgi:transposase
VREYDTICIGNPRSAEVARDRRFAKMTADAGHGALLAKLRYKCEWYGKELDFTDPFLEDKGTAGWAGT